MTTRIPKEALPSPIGHGNYQGIRPETLHFGAIESMLAEQTTALWYRNLGNRHSYFWAQPEYAPTVSMTTHDTWTYAYFNATAFLAIPWHCQNGATKIRIRALLSARFFVPVLVKFTLGNMNAAGSTDSADIDLGKFLPLYSAPNGRWRAYCSHLYYAEEVVEPASFHADRMLSIQLQAKFRGRGGVNPYNATLEPSVTVCSMLINDEFPEPTG